MDRLRILVEQRTVNNLGISDSTALQSTAAIRTLALMACPLSIDQGRWNVMSQDVKHDMNPMARHLGRALAPWNVIGFGSFQRETALKEVGEGLRSLRGLG